MDKWLNEFETISQFLRCPADLITHGINNRRAYGVGAIRVLLKGANPEPHEIIGLYSKTRFFIEVMYRFSIENDVNFLTGVDTRNCRCDDLQYLVIQLDIRTSV